MYSLGVIVRSLLYSNHRVELFLLLLVGVSFTRWISVFDGTKNVKIRFFRYTNFLSCFPKRFISIDHRYDGSSTIVRKLEGTFSLFIRSIVPV